MLRQVCISCQHFLNPGSEAALLLALDRAVVSPGVEDVEKVLGAFFSILNGECSSATALEGPHPKDDGDFVSLIHNVLFGCVCVEVDGVSRSEVNDLFTMNKVQGPLKHA